VILQSSSFEPMDPWLSGESMQYYYFGYLAAADLIKLSCVPPAIGFNLGVASMFALSAAAAYGIGKNLVNSRIFGIIIMAFVVIFGNPAGFIQFFVILFVPEYYYLFNVPDGDFWTRLSAFNYWPASRVIPDTINEFAYFSFLQGDLHAHMIGIAFQLLMIALLLNLLIQEKKIHIPTIAVIPLVLGFMFTLNTWDYPTYAAFFLIILMVWGIRVFSKSNGGFTEQITGLHYWDILTTAGIGALVMITSIILYLPYHLAGSISHPICSVTYGHTRLLFYLGVFGIQLFFIMLYVMLNFSKLYYPDRKLLFLIFSGLVISIAAAYLTGIQIFIITLPLTGFSVCCLIKTKDPSIKFIYLLILTGALLCLFCELFYIQDSLGISLPQYIRLNTVFKLYNQIWIVWALAAGVSFYHLWNWCKIQDVYNRKLSLAKVLSLIMVLLILASLSYPVFATYSRSDNFHDKPTLDGAAYFKDQYPNEHNAILWLNNMSGLPVVLQSPGIAYKLNTHVTTFTGLPAVIGWVGHEKTWRNRAKIIDERVSEVSMVYTSGNIEKVDQILDKYQVEYIYIGMVEQERYGGYDVRGLFEDNPGRFELVYVNPDVLIYRVIR
jgi:YYY domain-containing protein